MQTPKRILIISYYWPPAGGPGVQRWLKFIKYLPDFGWNPTVFIPENPSYPLLDDSLLRDIPKNLEIIKTKIWEPYRWAEKLNRNNKKFKAGQFDVGENQSWKSKLSIFVRGNFFIPDARVFWVKPSVRYLKKYLQENKIDVLVTTGPPHSLHLIGLQLKKKFPNIKWVADFRDPWTEISYYKHLKLTKSSDKKHKTLERQVFENANLTLATSYTDAENFNKKGARAVCITNGFDDEDGIVKNEVGKWEKLDNKVKNRFILSYIGVLEQLRNPNKLWEVLNDLVQNHEDFRKDFQLKFVGRVDDKILENLQNSELRNNITDMGYIAHDKALLEMASSHILLITNFPQESSKGIIPGKIFEYLATGKQIISFGPQDSDVARILSETRAGKHFSYHDTEEVKNFIIEQYQLWKQNKTENNLTDIKQFSRKNLTRQLSEVLERLF
ncbi:MAG: glycosyltransferase family 4 protein [Cloacibacterium sp.]|nr:glycosyltransferase family 4 protein [Cloacibacterium sp.]